MRIIPEREGKGMTQNQIAYQQNKLREEENRIKAREAETKAREQLSKQRINESQHIHDYGYFEVPNDEAFHKYGSKLSMTQMGPLASSTVNAEKGSKITTAAASLIKSLLPSGGFFGIH